MTMIDHSFYIVLQNLYIQVEMCGTCNIHSLLKWVAESFLGFHTGADGVFILLALVLCH